MISINLERKATQKMVGWCRLELEVVLFPVGLWRIHSSRKYYYYAYLRLYSALLVLKAALCLREFERH